MKKLRDYRKRARMTQAELAELVGCKRVNITRLEAGAINGSVSIWLRIQDALKLSSKELLDAMKDKEERNETALDKRRV